MKASSVFKRTVKEAKSLPNCKQTYIDNGCALFETPLLYIRVLDGEEEVTVHLGEKKTFDRWANSINFITEISKGPGHYYPLFAPQYKWALKVVKSKLFNFNSYIGSIGLPWFETKQNKRLANAAKDSNCSK